MRCYETTYLLNEKTQVSRFFSNGNITPEEIDNMDGRLSTISDIQYIDKFGEITTDHEKAKCVAIAAQSKRVPFQFNVSDFYNLLSLEDQKQPEQLDDLVGKRLLVYFKGGEVAAFCTLGTEWDKMEGIQLTNQKSLENLTRQLSGSSDAK